MINTLLQCDGIEMELTSSEGRTALGICIVANVDENVFLHLVKHNAGNCPGKFPIRNMHLSLIMHTSLLRSLAPNCPVNLCSKLRCCRSRSTATKRWSASPWLHSKRACCSCPSFNSAWCWSGINDYWWWYSTHCKLQQHLRYWQFNVL